MNKDLVRRRWLRLLWLVIGSIAVGGWFQSPSDSPAEIPAPTIRVSTHMVLVDVVITDKQGRAVTGLHKEDFVVEENGKAQKIATFATPEESKTSTLASLPPGIYSNRPQYRTPGGPITVLLLDVINTAFQDQAYARHQMLRFVREQLGPDQRMAVFTLTGGLNELQDFTSDPQVLMAALERYRPEPQKFEAAGPPARAVSPSLSPALAQAVAIAQQAVTSFEGAQIAYAEDQRVVLTLSALNSLARILGGIPGRKNIIWVTGAFPFTLIPENRAVTQAELEESLPSLDIRRVGQHAAGNNAATFRQAHADQIRETAARLAGAQVAIYPIDARGLSISTNQDAQETMKEMARETGGRAYVNQNEIKEGVAMAFADQYAAYTLGYYPDNKKWDGKYRQIKVKVNRDGVEARSRRGYFTIDPTRAKDYNPEQEVASALKDVVPSTLVAFTVRVLSPSANSAKGKVGVDFLVDASTLSAEDASGGKKLNLAFYSVVFTPAGKMLANQSMKVDQTFDADTYQKILQHGLMLHMDLDPQPGNNLLRLAVQDNRTGLVGTVEAPLSP
jgi:VWFA-related protein